MDKLCASSESKPPRLWSVSPRNHNYHSWMISVSCLVISHNAYEFQSQPLFSYIFTKSTNKETLSKARNSSARVELLDLLKMTFLGHVKRTASPPLHHRITMTGHRTKGRRKEDDARQGSCGACLQRRKARPATLNRFWHCLDLGLRGRTSVRTAKHRMGRRAESPNFPGPLFCCRSSTSSGLYGGGLLRMANLV